MPIGSSFFISGRVGAGGRNTRENVPAVQPRVIQLPSEGRYARADHSIPLLGATYHLSSW